MHPFNHAAVLVSSAHGTNILAVPMYNLPPNTNHPQGAGKGCVVTLGGQKLYFSGDTEDTPTWHSSA